MKQISIMRSGSTYEFAYRRLFVPLPMVHMRELIYTLARAAYLVGSGVNPYWREVEEYR